MPSPAASSAARTARSIESRDTPGSDGHRLLDVRRPRARRSARSGCRPPSRTSAAISRIQGVRRRRRGRESGKGAIGVIGGLGSRVLRPGVGSGPGLACAARRLKARSRCRRPAIDGGARGGQLGPRAAPARTGSSPCFASSPPPASRASGTGCCTSSSGRWSATARSACPTTCCSAPAATETAAERVELLAGLSAERIGGIHELAGVPLAAAAGLRPRRARRPRLPDRPRGRPGGLPDPRCRSPRSPIPSCASRSSCAAAGVQRPELVLVLSRRRFWHQTIAVAAMLAAAAVAWSLHPPRPI